jgi:hypothetical protein
VIALLQAFLRWLREDGCFTLDGPVIVQDGSVWLRIAPGEQTRWYGSLAEALHA